MKENEGNQQVSFFVLSPSGTVKACFYDKNGADYDKITTNGDIQLRHEISPVFKGFCRDCATL